MNKKTLKDNCFLNYILVVLILLSLVYGIESLKNIYDLSGRCYFNSSFFLKVIKLENGFFETEIQTNYPSKKEIVKMKRSDILKLNPIPCPIFLK